MATIIQFAWEHIWLIILVVGVYMLIMATRKTIEAAAQAEKLNATIDKMEREKRELDKQQAELLNVDFLKERKKP
jgi:uncharacterized membrane-anchored protein YhcB (DUF1043 family)